MSITLLSGDCRDVLPTLGPNSVHCVVTSPPYYGLRDYGTAQWDGGDAACDHIKTVYTPASYSRGHHGSDRGCQGWRGGERNQSEPYGHVCGKCGARRVDRQIGLEATPDEYLATMVGVFREVKRVMRSDAVAFVNMGDGYRDKQLQMIPARLAIALQADGWFLRSDIIWHKPNPMPESCRDRPTSAYEHVFLLTRSARYYYDAEAVREESEPSSLARAGIVRKPSPKELASVETGNWSSAPGQSGAEYGIGRNCRNVWTIATHAFSAAHFATYPPELVERCIKAGCPKWGTVLDPFAGAGTTLLVADRLQRNAVGIELNAAYTTMAMDRVRADAPLFADTPEPQPVPGFAQPDLFAEAAD